MQSLDALIDHYGTDKAISGYSKSYEYLFNDIKNEVTSLLEFFSLLVIFLVSFPFNCLLSLN